MSQIRRDDRRSVRYTESSEVTGDLAPVRPTEASCHIVFTAPVTSTPAANVVATIPQV
jgi:hypothetical protein